MVWDLVVVQRPNGVRIGHGSGESMRSLLWLLIIIFDKNFLILYFLISEDRPNFFFVDIPVADR